MQIDQKSKVLYPFAAVLWDMDGTLLDSEPLWLRAETELMEEFGVTWTTDDQLNCLGGPAERIGRYMFERSGGVESPTFFVDQVFKRTAKLFETDLRVMPGVRQRLEELYAAGIPMALVTASPRELADTAVNVLGAHFFSAVVSCDDVVNSKPDPESYFSAARQLQVDISKCLIFEDSHTGVKAAQASGASVVAIAHMVTFEPHPRSTIIPNIADIATQSLSEFYIDQKELHEHI